MSAAVTSSPGDVLDTLLLPFATGEFAWPAEGTALFLRARATAALRGQTGAALVCAQSFKPFADELVQGGFVLGEGESATHPLVLLLPPRCREEARTLLAHAWDCTAPGGIVLAAAANNEGARSHEADLARLAGSVASLSKHKGRVFWARRESGRGDAGLLGEWQALDAPRRIDAGPYFSRPGLFAWSRIDAASALLARCLPADLSGRGADLGAGFGYLAAEVAQRCAGVTVLDLYEAEARGLELARQNLSVYANGITLAFLWHDVTTGLPSERRYDFIVSNPPFHQGRADQPEIGRAFLAAAAAGLIPGGRFWLVANRHLPYEEALRREFRRVREVCAEQGFKVIEAIR